MATTTTNHTPGPWVVTVQPLDPVSDEGGIFIHNHHATIAVCDSTKRLPVEEQIANARLMAEAPDMYKVIEALAQSEIPPAWAIQRAQEIVRRLERP
jgi:hypothetical protein